MSSSQVSAPDGAPKGSRVWIDGCFDLFQYANVQLLFAAKQYAKRLIVGIHNNNEMEDNKNDPFFDEDDRYRLISSLKWVDEIVEDAPFTTTISSLNQLDCDFCLITEPSMTNFEGENRQAEIAKTNRHKKIGVAGLLTENEIIGRVFLQNCTHHFNLKYLAEQRSIIEKYALKDSAPYTKISIFSDHSLNQLSVGRNPRPTDKIVYVVGDFDIFNVSHLSLLENAAKTGDYLIVGLFSDEVINKKRGNNFPITNVLERLLTLASTKVVNEIVIDVPTTITSELLHLLNVTVVVQGFRDEKVDYDESKKLGIYNTVHFDSEFTTQTVVEKVVSLRGPFHDENIKDIEIESYRDTPTNNELN